MKTKYSLMKNKVTGVRSIRINETGEMVRESEDPGRYNILRKRAKANTQRAVRDDVYRSCGLVKTPYGWE